MHNHAQDVAWTGQHSVCPDSVLEAEAFLLLLVRPAHILPHKLVDLIVRRVSQHVVSRIVHEVLLSLLLRERDRLSELPVRLAVQLVRLDEDRTALLRRLEQDQIRGHALILHNLDNVAHLDVLRGNRHDFVDACRLSLQYRIFGVIELFVAPEAIEIVPTFLDHRDKEYERQRSDIGKEEADLEEWYKLAHGDDQEEHVEEKLELVVEHLEDERENVVLLIVQAVRDEG